MIKSLENLKKNTCISLKCKVESAYLHTVGMIQELGEDLDNWTEAQLKEYDEHMAFVNENWRKCK